ncbi:MAG: CapA family protein [Muribaculaceae bacterium]|nr:CapA family protein [Muribaculaceae bacterium]
MSLLSILMLSIVSLLESNHTVNLTFVGDAMQHAPQITAAQQSDGTYDYSPCFENLRDDIAWADLAVVNLECPLGGRPYTGYPCFSAPDSYAQQLKDVGFDLFLTANNHCLDRRDKGLVRTCQTLDSLGIPHIGTYPDQQARDKAIPLIVNVKGMKIAFLDYTYGTNGIPIQGNVIVDFIDQQQIAQDITTARERGAHAICVNLHWGIEYQLKPVASQRDLADWLVSQGVDLIIGGHPHVVEPMEVRYCEEYDKNVLLVYSMGNFISNQSDIDTRGGAMVKVSLRMENGRAVIVEPRYKLFFVQKPRSGGENYVLIPESRPDLLRPDSKGEFTRFMQRTHDLVTSHNIDVPNEQ